MRATPYIIRVAGEMQIKTYEILVSTKVGERNESFITCNALLHRVFCAGTISFLLTNSIILVFVDDE